MPAQTPYQANLVVLIRSALQSPGLLSPNQFNLARYSLNPHTRNRLLDPDISALEDYLIDHSQLPGFFSNLELLHAFGDAVAILCHDEATPLRQSYQNLSWLLAWLNMHHPPSFFGEDPDSPLQMLQMAAAVGRGEWAAAFNQIEEGVENLLMLANSPLWRVRQTAALGLQRMLKNAWNSTLLRLRHRAIIANPLEWRTMLAAMSDLDLLIGDEQRGLDALEFYQQALRTVFTPDEDTRVPALIEILSQGMAVVVQAAPQIGFAQMTAWAQWNSPPVKQIIRENLTFLGEWADQVAGIEKHLS